MIVSEHFCIFSVCVCVCACVFPLLRLISHLKIKSSGHTPLSLSFSFSMSLSIFMFIFVFFSLSLPSTWNLVRSASLKCIARASMHTFASGSIDSRHSFESKPVASLLARHVASKARAERERQLNLAERAQRM